MWQFIKKFFRVAFASAMGLGLCPIAPGTCGTVLGIPIYLGIIYLAPEQLHLILLSVSFLLVCIAHWLLTPWAQEYWQSKDPRHFVLDEVAGFLLVPILFHGGRPWQVALWGFLIFRVLDIIKPPPADRVDAATEGALGILGDDLISGAYTALFLYAFQWAAPRFGTGWWLISGS